MSSPKVVIIGAGSFFFGRPVIWNMVQSEVLRGGTLALVDTNAEVLDTFVKLAERAIEATGALTKVVASTDRREVLKDADFVVYTFSDRNAYFRGLDCEIALKHGVRMCSGDTIGSGGIFRACREIPKALDMAKDIEELAPNAWIINFVNPTTVLGIALAQYAPNVRSFAICDGLHMPGLELKILKNIGLLPDDANSIPADMLAKLDARTPGVNHFTWMCHLEYDGKNMMPAYREYLVKRVEEEKQRADAALNDGIDDNAASKSKHNAEYELRLFDIFGAYPNRIGHTKEYVPYFQGYGNAPSTPPPVTIFDPKLRQEKMDEMYQGSVDYATGKTPIQEFIKNGRSDHATDIIESMWGGLGKQFYINTPNCGAVSNMPDNAYLELKCDVSMNGLRPSPMGDLPLAIRGLTQQILDTHELTAKAAAEFDRDALLQAIAIDPIMNNINDAEAIIAETFERQKDGLDPRWYE
jgi:alpha-galactosidase/6-phospho-beta-glucosidase family protein